MFLLNLLYALATFVIWLLVISPLRATWWVQFLNLFTPWYFLPIPLLLALSALNRNWLSILILILPTALFVVEYGAHFYPQQRRLPSDREMPHRTQQLRLMTWNVLYLNKNIAATLAAIQRQRPDILLLQELGVDLAHGLVDALATDYPHQSLFASNSPSGYGIFSRYPITQVIPPQRHRDHHWCQEICIAVGSEEVTLINAHPRIPDIHLRYWAGIPIPVGFDTELQDVQLRRLLERVDQAKGALLLAGDFNLNERQPMYREFACRLGDAQRNAGWGLGFTFPTNLAILDYFKVPIPALPMVPFLRLDYVFYNRSWRAQHLWSGSAAGSDHRYLVADFEAVGCNVQEAK